ncbi:MAG: hypothetical protein R2751_19840 [Bacteroidales bacterium]
MITLGFTTVAIGGNRPVLEGHEADHPRILRNPRGHEPRLPVFRVLGEILSHANFAACGSRKVRKWAHMLLFFSFALLLILVTLYAIWATVTHVIPCP